MMFKFLRNKLLLKMLVFYLIFIIIPLLLISNLISSKLSDEVINNAAQLINSNLKTISVNIDEILRNVEFSFNPMLTDGNFLNNLRRLKTSEQRLDYDDIMIPNEISDFINKVFSNNNYLQSIYLYADRGRTFFTTRIGVTSNCIQNNFDPKKTDWYRSYIQNSMNNRWVTIPSLENDKQLIANYKEIRDFGGTLRTALISINISTNTISEIINKNSFTPKGHLIVIDGKGKILSNNENFPADCIGLIRRGIPDNKVYGWIKLGIKSENTFAAFYRSEYSGLLYIFEAPLKAINTTSSTTRFYPIVTSLFILLILVTAILITYFYMYKPIRSMVAAMKKIEVGDFNVKLKDERSDEIGYINKHFNNMVSNLNKLIEENYVYKLLKKDAELRSIVSQINEHFLYNSLDTIHWKARQYNAPEVCDIIFSLSKFYRLVLSSGKDIVTIRDIVEMASHYINIQKFRMQDSLRFEIQADETLWEIKVLKYLFQPLIENAITHGIGKKPGGGGIRVTFERLGNLIKFQVEDDGAGISAEKLEQIKKDIDSEHHDVDDYFALKSINTQIKMFYGSDYSIYIESTEGIGTRAGFRIPMITDERDIDA